jgi:hypothetical protein
MKEALSDPMEDYRCGALADNLLEHYTNYHKLFINLFIETNGLAINLNKLN